MASVDNFIGYEDGVVSTTCTGKKVMEKIQLAQTLPLGRYHEKIVRTLATMGVDGLQTTRTISPELVISEVKGEMQDRVNNALNSAKVHTEVLTDGYSVDTWRFGEGNIPKEIISAIAELFEEGFGYGSDGWGEHMLCSSCEQVFTVEESFGLEQGTYIPLKELREKHKVVATCSTDPAHPLSHFWDKNLLEKELEKKFVTEDGSLITLKDIENNIVGYAWCYPANFETANKNEFDQFYKDHPSVIADFKKGVSEELGSHFDDNSEVLVWNSIGIQYGHRSLLHTLKMVYNLMTSIPENFSQRPIIMEAKAQSSFYRYLRAAGGVPKANGVKEGYVVMLGAKKVEGYSNFWSYDPEEFKAKYNDIIRSYKYKG